MLFDKSIKTPNTFIAALALGVLIPSMSILWFMTQALNNERLAASQKVALAYRSQLENIDQTWQHYWHQTLQALAEQSLSNNHLQTVTSARLFFKQAIINNHAQGIVVALPHAESSTDSESIKTLYPNNSLALSTQNSLSSPMVNRLQQQAQMLEFTEQNYSAAILKYQQLLALDTPIEQHLQYLLFTARLLVKSEQYVQAFQLISEQLLASQHKNKTTSSGRNIAVNALIMGRKILLSAPQESWSNKDALSRHLLSIASERALDYTLSIPAAQRYFLMQEFNQRVEESPLFSAEKLSQKFVLSLTNQQVARLSSSQLTYLANLDSWAIKITNLHLSHKHTDSVTAEPYYVIALFTQEQLNQTLQSLVSLPSDIEVLLSTPFDHKPHSGSDFIVQMSTTTDTTPNWSILLRYKTQIDKPKLATSTLSNIYLYFTVAIVLIAIFTIIALYVSKHLLKQKKLHLLKTDLMTTITHELKTPLSSSRLLIEILLTREKPLDQQTIDYLTLIDDENIRLSRLIDNFLTFSKMETSKPIFDFQDCDLNDIVNSALQPFKKKLIADGFQLAVNLGRLEDKVTGDFDLLVVVISNLIENAYKYSSHQKILRIQTSNVQYQNKQWLSVKVTDTGIGISEQCQKSIFQRFYRADSQLSQSVSGCGLGLYIAQDLIEQHQGMIEVESQLTKGSTFTLYLPIKKTPSL